MSEKMNCSKERTIRHFLMGFCLLCMMIMVTAVSSKAYAVTAGDTGYVNYTYLNMRKGPATSYDLVVKLSQNDKVTIKSVTSNNWYQVSAVHSGKTYTGYVASNYITLNSTTTTTTTIKTTTANAGRTGYVNYTYLNMRKGPATSYALIVKLSKNDKVTVKATTSDGKWYQVSAVHSGTTYTGYVSVTYITLNSTTTSTTTKTTSTAVGKKGYVNNSYLNMRKGPATSYALVVKLSKYDVVTIKAVSGNWYQVSASHAGKTYTGYVSATYITIGDVPASVQKVVYLTFDDGPGKYTQQLLNILAKYNAKATFFVTGQYSSYFGMIAKEAKAGHTVALHSYSHDYSKIYTSKTAFYTDLNKIANVVYQQTGKSAKIIRFPGGSSNTVSKKYCKGIMTTLTKDVVAKGYYYADWNVDSDDAGSAKTATAVANNVIAGIKAHKTSVVLQHDVKSYSVSAVEQILKWGTENGYVFKAMTTSSPMAHHSVNN